MTTRAAAGPTVVVVGSLNMDLLIRVPHLPRPGETVSGRTLEQSCGGKGANQAVAARRLGAEVRLIGVVGTDTFGDTLLDRLDAERVDMSAVTRSTTAPTGVALIVVDGVGENMITLAPGANHELLGAQMDGLHATLAGAQALLVQLEVPVPTVLAAARAARQAGVTVVLNAAPLPPVVDSALRELLGCTDLLVVNETEAAGLAATGDGRSGHLATAEALRRLGPAEVVLTLGGDGAVIADQDGARHIEAFAVTAVDTVGAGDAFCAALAIARTGAGLTAATRWACAAGALATTRTGAQDAMPARADVENLLLARTVTAGQEVPVDASYGLWHPRLLGILTAAGHGDLIVIADAGLPVPAGVETIDLLWQRGDPAFLPVLRAVLAECVVEHAYAAHELTGRPVHDGLLAALGPVPLTSIPHTELKQRTAAARVVVRTGEATPYANVVLRCGVAF